jgi:hypothetical protein
MLLAAKEGIRVIAGCRGGDAMDVSKTHLTKTYEGVTRKISLTRIETLGKDHKGVVIGWEYAAPAKGERYTIYLGKGKILRTSTVEEVKEMPRGIMIKTMNSIYRIEYLEPPQEPGEHAE